LFFFFFFFLLVGFLGFFFFLFFFLLLFFCLLLFTLTGCFVVICFFPFLGFFLFLFGCCFGVFFCSWKSGGLWLILFVFLFRVFCVPMFCWGFFGSSLPRFRVFGVFFLVCCGVWGGWVSLGLVFWLGSSRQIIGWSPWGRWAGVFVELSVFVRCVSPVVEGGGD